jgi:zinc transporter ZupT
MGQAADMKSSRVTFWLSALLPLGLLAVLLVVFWRSSGGLRFAAPAPLENIAFDRVVLREDEIVAHVRNVGPESVTIAQVQVGWLNRASWEFTVEPSPTIERLRTARVHIPYPWTEGEPCEIVLFTANGLPFTHTIAIATATPQLNAANLLLFSQLGVYVGVIPVFLGILWLPFLRQLGERAMGFLLSLTIGLLVFLGVDALGDALEQAGELPGPFQGVALILIGVAVSLLGLYTLSRTVESRQRRLGGDVSLALAYLVAFSIGMHNLGEGLAIGGAYALGEIATGALFIIGFMIHNLTEGIAVVAPVARAGFGAARGGRSWLHLVWLGALAGVPTVFGSALGAFAPSPVYAVLFLSIGAGAVFQVVMEIVRQMRRSAPAEEGAPAFVSLGNLAGFLAGLAVMYVTGLFLTV